MNNISNIAMFSSSLKVACQAKRLITYVSYNKQNLYLLRLLLSQGCIRYFNIVYKSNFSGFTYLSIKVFLVFVKHSTSLIRDIKLISKSGSRVYWPLDKLFFNLNRVAFSGFYIISTKNGLFISNDLIFKIPYEGKLSGEILLKFIF